MPASRLIPVLILLVAAVLLAGTVAARAVEPVSDVNGIRYSGEYGQVAYTVGIDYRLEVLELLENWTGGHDPELVSEIQMPPLRRALLDELAPWRDHRVVGLYRDLDEQYNVGIPVRMLLSAGDLGTFDTGRDWHGGLWPAIQERISDPVAFNDDYSELFNALNELVVEADLAAVFSAHDAEYQAVVEELYSVAVRECVLETVLTAMDFPDAEIAIIGSPLIQPGRNYATFNKGQKRERLEGIYYMGPFKQIVPNMLLSAGWSEVPVTFADRDWFIEECVHEMAHMLLGDAVAEAVAARSAEYVELLRPVEEVLGDAYGALPDRAAAYIDELATRAFTLELIRRLKGEAEFRRLAEREIRFTRGYAVLLWRDLFSPRAVAAGEPLDLDGVLAGLPAVLSGWTEEDLAPFRSSNEYTVNLGIFFRDFIPTFYPQNPVAFALSYDEDLPEDWRAGFQALLSERLHVPAELQVLEDPGDCPFVIEVRLVSVEEFAAVADRNGFAWDGEVVDAEGWPAFMVTKDLREERGVSITWHLLEAADPAQLVPYYMSSATHILFTGGRPAGLDCRTTQSMLVTEWLR